MLTAREYRHHAVECRGLAEQADEPYVKAALLELAAEFQTMAEFLEEPRTRAYRQAEAAAPQRRRRAG